MSISICQQDPTPSLTLKNMSAYPPVPFTPTHTQLLSKQVVLPTLASVRPWTWGNDFNNTTISMPFSSEGYWECYATSWEPIHTIQVLGRVLAKPVYAIVFMVRWHSLDTEFQRRLSAYFNGLETAYADNYTCVLLPPTCTMATSAFPVDIGNYKSLLMKATPLNLLPPQLGAGLAQWLVFRVPPTNYLSAKPQTTSVPLEVSMYLSLDSEPEPVDVYTLPKRMSQQNTIYHKKRSTRFVLPELTPVY